LYQVPWTFPAADHSFMSQVSFDASDVSFDHSGAAVDESDINADSDLVLDDDDVLPEQPVTYHLVDWCQEARLHRHQ